MIKIVPAIPTTHKNTFNTLMKITEGGVEGSLGSSVTSGSKV